jgi:hypothetical protein
MNENQPAANAQQTSQWLINEWRGKESSIIITSTSILTILSLTDFPSFVFSFLCNTLN